MSKIHPKFKDLKITVITGAGFSHPSGVPTFRGKEGLWRQYNVHDLATPSAFSRNPSLVWEWYHWRINLIQKAQPNRAHLLLSELESIGSDIEILTQNVDDLQERAGSKRITHLHGEIMKTKCIECKSNGIIDENYLKTSKPTSIPICPDCGGKIRPDVVWFGETLDHSIVQFSYQRLEQTDLLIVAGTSAVVYPVAEFPYYARRLNSDLNIVEFNIESTPISNIATKTFFGSIEDTLSDFLANDDEF
jgi:NAD-dependent deacetylase